jgi:hypothetical protein
MRRLLRILLPLLLVAVLAGVCWHAFGPDGRHYQGRTQREWIASLSGSPGTNEIEKWRALGPDAVPMLITALRQGSGPAARLYFKIWSRLPPKLKSHLSRPQDTVNIRRSAPLVLLALTDDISAAAPALGGALYDEDQYVRANAARCLENQLPGLGPAGAHLLPDLLFALHDSNQSVREYSVQSLGHYPEQSRIVAPALARALGDSGRMVRYLAVQSLKRMNLAEATAGGIGPVLLPSVDSSDLYVCVNASQMVSQMKCDPKAEVPVFIGMLGSYLPGKQRLAAVALGKYGPQAASAIPALRHAFETGEPLVREAASNALAQIDPQALANLSAGTNAVAPAATN